MTKNQPTPRDQFVSEFIAAVKEEIERRGISHAYLAAKAGCSRTYLTNVLNGHYDPSIAWAQKIGKILGLKISFTISK